MVHMTAPKLDIIAYLEHGLADSTYSAAWSTREKDTRCAVKAPTLNAALKYLLECVPPSNVPSLYIHMGCASYSTRVHIIDAVKAVGYKPIVLGFAFDATVVLAQSGIKSLQQINKQQVPLRWMAPESLVKQPVYSRKTDVWSFAVLMYEIFNNGQKPWPDEEPKKIATMIRKCQMPDMPKNTPTEIKGLANAIWIKDMDSRPEFKKILIELFEVHHIHKPPEPKKCSTNRLPGVTRCPFDERLEDVRYRVIDLNQPTEDTRTRENINEESDPLTCNIVGNVQVVPNPTIRGAMLIDEPSTMTGIPLKPDEEVALPAVKGQPIKYVAGKKKAATTPVPVPAAVGGGGSSRKRNLPAKT